MESFTSSPTRPETSPAPRGKDYFWRAHPLAQLQARISRYARSRMVQVWREFRELGPKSGMDVLDIGATPDLLRVDSNCMIQYFQDDGLKVTLYSIEDISNLKDVFPETQIILGSVPLRRVPCRDRAYSWAVSSAVLEHVGGKAAQLRLIREMGRVADGIFLTTPNRFHWLEFHTKLPFLHWLPRPWYAALMGLLGLGEWVREVRLRLLGRRELLAMAKRALGEDFHITIRQIWTLGFPSNLLLLARRRVSIDAGQSLQSPRGVDSRRAETPQVTVLFPCLNEEKTLGRCISTAHAVLSRTAFRYEVLVADNGSTDRSREIGAEGGARVVSVHPRGYGHALTEGLRQALGEVVVFMDPDGSYWPSSIPRMISPILEGRADLVLGSRLNLGIEQGAMPALNRWLGTPILSLLMRICHKIPTTDCNSGIRALRRSSYSEITFASGGMEFASELLVLTAKLKLRYVEVGVLYSRDQRGRPSHLRRWADGLKHLKLIISSVIW